MEQIRTVLNADERIEPGDPQYVKESQVWAAHKNLHPQLVARPKSIETLSTLLKTLNGTDVESNVRGGGCGSASSRGVLISMSAFDNFSFDKDEETVTVGAGQLWRHVDQKVEKHAPGYSGAFSVHRCFKHKADCCSCGSTMYICRRRRRYSARRTVLDVERVRSGL